MYSGLIICSYKYINTRYNGQTCVQKQYLNVDKIVYKLQCGGVFCFEQNVSMSAFLTHLVGSGFTCALAYSLPSNSAPL